MNGRNIHLFFKIRLWNEFQQCKKKKKPKSGKCYAIQLPITTSKAYSYFWIEYFSEIMYVKILNNVYFKCVFFLWGEARKIGSRERI